jgi:hypothetical protein
MDRTQYGYTHRDGIFTGGIRVPEALTSMEKRLPHCAHAVRPRICSKWMVSDGLYTTGEVGNRESVKHNTTVDAAQPYRHFKPQMPVTGY